MTDGDKDKDANDEVGDDAAETDTSVGHANIEKVDEILDHVGANEGIAAGSRETHPHEDVPES